MIWILLVLCSVGLVLLWRVPRCPTVPSAPPQDAPTISVIIPARNEADNLPRLLTSIAELDVPPHEVIVMDDGSTDGTASLARARGATIYPVPSLPDRWRGKTWACWNGAARATGDWLLFLDADTFFATPDALRRMIAAQTRMQSRALSLVPYHATKQPYEQLSAVFNLLTAAGVDAFSLYGSADRPHGLFGPDLLIERSAYQQCGGHAAVRSEILENMSLAPILRAQGIPMACCGGRGVLHIRMYPDGLRALIDGWTKAFAAGANKASPAALLLSIAWLSGGMLACVLPLAAPHLFGGPLSAAVPYAAYCLVLWRLLRPLGTFPPWVSVLYPAFFIAFFVIFGRSLAFRARCRPVTWKGREIAAEKMS